MSKKQLSKKQDINKASNKKVKVVSTSNELSNLIKIITAVIAISVIFYFITTLITGENKEENVEPDEITIQYDEILLGNLFSQPNTEYYVLITKKDDDYVLAYKTYLSAYASKDNVLKVYYVDLNNGFNKAYYSEESNIDKSNITEMKFKGTTLLQIKDKKVVAFYETKEAILAQLKTMVK